MKINQVVEIIRGELLNSPKISFIAGLYINSKKIKEGSLFLSNNTNEIKKAIKKGAFCIVSEKDISDFDNEIALIRVRDLDDAKIRLLRYYFSDKNWINFYSLNKVFVELFRVYKEDNFIIYKDFDSFFEEVFNVDIEEIDHIILPSSIDLCEKIATTYSVDFIIYEGSEVVVHSLFETSFEYNGVMFERVKIPAIYVKYLIFILEFFLLPPEENIIKKAENIDIFKPIFVNRSYEVVEFGKSDKFIISATEFFEKEEIEFIKQYFRYGKIKIVYGCKNIKFDNKNCLYVKQCKRDNILKKLNNSKIVQLSLF